MLPKPSGPLVLTLSLDSATQTTLNALRKRYFPPHRNFLGAHITLFHAIPSHRLPELDRRLTELCAGQRTFDVYVGEPQAMGKGGVMLMIRAQPPHSIEAIHRRLVKELKQGLTEQDTRLGRPHVTVLNKAEERVEQCLEDLKGFREVRGRGEGLQLWEYKGGPWEPIKMYPFAR